jgi:hypothetical protein
MTTIKYSNDYYQFLLITENPAFVEEVEEIRQFFTDIGFPIIKKEVASTGLQVKWSWKLANYLKTIEIPDDKQQFVLFGSKLKQIMKKYGLNPKNESQFFLINHYFFTKELLTKPITCSVGTLNLTKSKHNGKPIIILEPGIKFDDLKKALKLAKKLYKEYFDQAKKSNKPKTYYDRDFALFNLFKQKNQDIPDKRKAINATYKDKQFSIIAGNSMSRNHLKKIIEDQSKIYANKA